MLSKLTKELTQRARVIAMCTHFDPKLQTSPEFLYPTSFINVACGAACGTVHFAVQAHDPHLGDFQRQSVWLEAARSKYGENSTGVELRRALYDSKDEPQQEHTSLARRSRW